MVVGEEGTPRLWFVATPVSGTKKGLSFSLRVIYIYILINKANVFINTVLCLHFKKKKTLTYGDEKNYNKNE